MLRKKAFTFSDVGNAERMAAYFTNEFHYVEGWKRFIVWDKKQGRWIDDIAGIRVMTIAKETIRKMAKESKPVAGDSQDVKNFKENLKKWATKSSEAARIRAMIDLVRDEPGIAISADKIDAKPFLFNCRNGTIDLTTGKFRGHQPGDLLTKAAKVMYNDRAQCPRWHDFLDKVLPDKATQRFLRAFIGYSLTGDVGERTMVVIHGPRGRNGKSVLIFTLQELLGDYATTAASGILMAKNVESHPAEIADLHGVRLAVTSESRKGRVFDEEKVKRFTGRDILKCRRMNENWWSFVATFKIIMVVNHMPRVKDASDSFWDRIALIPFLTRITRDEEDPGVLDKLLKELPGILNWALEGLADHRQNGLTRTKVIEAATLGYRAAEDDLEQFVQERLEFSKNCRAASADLIRAGKSWGEKYDRFFSSRDLFERLRNAGCEPSVWESGRTRGWKGVGLIPLNAADAAKARPN